MIRLRTALASTGVIGLLWTIALTGAVTTTALVETSGPAFASSRPIGACTTTSGVILAVDFSHWDGPLLRACGTTPTTGYQLLNQGGWSTVGDNHDGPAFVCRIGYSGFRGGTRYPTASQEACILTPRGDAYWSYWYADPGHNSWSYGRLGAMTHYPKSGGVELWVFGKTDTAGTQGSGVPTLRPDSIRARNTVPVDATPTPKSDPTTKTPPHTGTSGSPTRGRSTPTTIGTPTGTPSPGASGVPTIVDVGPAAEPASTGPGSATPAIVALVIVLLLGAVGVTIALRRPRREP